MVSAVATIEEVGRDATDNMMAYTKVILAQMQNQSGLNSRDWRRADKRIEAVCRILRDYPELIRLVESAIAQAVQEMPDVMRAVNELAREKEKSAAAAS